MAGTVQTMAVFVDPKFMLQVAHEDPKGLIALDANVAKLADLIGRDAFELSQRSPSGSPTGSSRSPRTWTTRRAPGSSGSTCRASASPRPTCGSTRWAGVAAHVLGGAGHDGRGLEGVELKFEKTLAGKDGYIRSRKDAQHRPISVAAEDYVPPRHGQHLVLTIDANVQLMAEQELAATCKQFKAKRGEVVVMDPKTGEVLALANWPAYHPQNMEDTLRTPGAAAEQRRWSPRTSRGRRSSRSWPARR
jgi:hypothetical protein